MGTKITTSIQVIDRAAALLDGIARYTQGVSLKILSAETGLHPSTAFRILASLNENGFVERDEAGAYRLGRRLLQLAARVRNGLDLRAEARPIMAWLRDQIGETVNLTLREGDEVIYVERAIPNRMMRVEQIIGSRAPLHVTAVGKLLLGEGDAEGLETYVARTGLPAYTPNTIKDRDRLSTAVNRAQALGYAFDDEEAEIGVGCIGMLIRDAGGTAVAGLSISAPIERRQQAWVELLTEATRRISERLGSVSRVARSTSYPSSP